MPSPAGDLNDINAIQEKRLKAHKIIKVVYMVFNLIKTWRLLTLMPKCIKPINKGPQSWCIEPISIMRAASVVKNYTRKEIGKLFDELHKSDLRAGKRELFVNWIFKEDEINERMSDGKIVDDNKL